MKNSNEMEKSISVAEFSEIMEKVQQELYAKVDEAIISAHKELSDLLYGEDYRPASKFLEGLEDEK